MSKTYRIFFCPMKSWVDKSIKSSLGYTYRLLKRWIVKLHVHNVSLRNNNIFCLIAGSKQTYWYVILITDQFNHKGGYIRVDLCFLNQIIRFFFRKFNRFLLAILCVYIDCIVWSISHSSSRGKVFRRGLFYWTKKP